MSEKITMIKCSTYADCINALCNEIGKDNDIEEKNIVFCEDKLTLTLEKSLANIEGGSFSTNVSTFKRYLSLNGDCDNVLSKSGSAVIIKRLLSKHQEEFKYFGKKNYNNLPSSIYNVINQLKSANVSVEDIRRCAESADGVLQNKLLDIAKIFSLYENEICDKWKDSGSYLKILPSVIRNDKTLKNKDIYFVGYSSWTVQGLNIVDAFIDSAKSVTLITVYGENKGFYLNEIATKFKKLVERKNQPLIEKNYINERENKSATVLKNNLYNSAVYSKDFEKYKADNVYFYTATNVTEECNYVAGIIRSNVINKGLRYRDFSVIVGNVKDYKNDIISVFNDYKIPYFFDEKRKLSDSLPYRFVKSILNVIVQNFGSDSVYSLLHNVVFPIDVSKKDKYYIKAKGEGINRNRFTKYFKDGSFKEITDLFIAIKENAVKKGTAKEFADSISKILNIFGTEKVLDDLQKSLQDICENDEANFIEQSNKRLAETVDEITKLSQDTPLTIEEYSSLLEVGASASEISLIPQCADGVYIAGESDAKLKKVNTLFAVGLNGDIPFSKSDTAILNDNDIDKLQELEVLIEPKISLANDRERENLCIALTSFTNMLILTHSIVNAMGVKQVNSEIIDYCKGIFGNGNYLSKERLKERLYGASVETQNKILGMDYLSTRPAMLAFAKNVSGYKDGTDGDKFVSVAFYYATDDERRKILDNVIYKSNDGYTKDKLTNMGELKTISASRLENYFSCPYKQFASNILYLNEEYDGDVRALDSGIIIHEIFEKFVKDYDKIKDVNAIDETVDNIVNTTLDKEDYNHFKEDGKTAYQLDCIKSEVKKTCKAIYEMFENSSFKPVGCEVAFGKNDSKIKNGEIELIIPKIEIDGGKGKVNLTGKIDRIDVTDEYIRVVDYKTGNEEDDAEKLYTGNKVQLYLYLNALKGTGKKPVGAYYFKTSDDYKKEDDERFVLSGHTVNDEDVLLKTDKNYTVENGSAILGVKKISGSKKTLSSDEINAFMDYSVKISSGGVAEIQEGFIAPTPYGKSCEYCKYNAICGFEEGVSGLIRPEEKVDSDNARIINSVRETVEEKVQ